MINIFPLFSHFIVYCALCWITVLSISDLNFDADFSHIPERLNLTPSLIPKLEPDVALGLDWSPMCCMWAQLGHCDEYPTYMRPHCQKSCGTFGCKDDESAHQCKVRIDVAHCPYIRATPQQIAVSRGTNNAQINTQEQLQCQDRHGSCTFWKQFGYCRKKRIHEYMLVNCPRSCNMCSVVKARQRIYDHVPQQRAQQRAQQQPKKRAPPADSNLFQFDFDTSRKSREVPEDQGDDDVVVLPPGTKFPSVGVPINDVIRNGLLDNSDLYEKAYPVYTQVLYGPYTSKQLDYYNAHALQRNGAVTGASARRRADSGRSKNVLPRISQKNLRRKLQMQGSRNRIVRFQ